MDDPRRIGQRVEQLRRAKGWSQGKLSSRMGLNNSAYISKLERGEIEQPTYERIALIARALGVADYELTGGAPPPGSSDQDFARALGDVLQPGRHRAIACEDRSADTGSEAPGGGHDRNDL